jgi:hypothetical protein
MMPGKDHGEGHGAASPLIFVLKGIRWLVSLLLAMAGGALFFLGLSMSIIFLLDTVMYRHSPYVNWLPNVYIPMVASFICLFIFVLLNLDRFKALAPLRDRLVKGRTRGRADEIELD